MSNETRPAQRGRAGQARRADASPRPSVKKGGFDPTTLAFLALVVVIIAGSAFLLVNKRQAADTGAIQEYSPSVTIEGEALPVFNAESVTTLTDTAVGMPAPVVAGQDFFGEATSLPVAGESTMIVFLAHWCAYCQAEVPLLMDEWIEGDLPDGVNVRAVPTGTNEQAVNFPPSAWLLADNDWTEPILTDTTDSQAAEAYGLAAYPFFVVVGPDGNVLARTSGELGRDQLQALVDVAAGAADAGSIGDTGEQSTVAPESNE